MNFFELVAAAVIGSFFVAGIVVGFLIVEVLPGDRGYPDNGDSRELPPYRDDDERPTRWPGG